MLPRGPIYHLLYHSCVHMDALSLDEWAWPVCRPFCAYSVLGLLHLHFMRSLTYSALGKCPDSCHIAAISSRSCCQAQSEEPDVLCAVAANKPIAGSWRRCQSQPTVQGCSSSPGELQFYNASCTVFSIVPYNQNSCLLQHR